MLKVRTVVMNGTFERDHVAAAASRRLPYLPDPELHHPQV
jgi:hypothetical protein